MYTILRWASVLKKGSSLFPKRPPTSTQVYVSVWTEVQFSYIFTSPDESLHNGNLWQSEVCPILPIEHVMQYLL